MIPALLAVITASAPAATELTVYNQGFALVKEVRTLDLKAGNQTVAITDVAERIEPDSVAVRSLDGPTTFTVLEQNYQFDLVSPEAILNKAVGGTIFLNRILPNGVRERLEGTLLSPPTSVVTTPDGASRQYQGLVVRTVDGRILLSPSGEIEVATIPEGLISRPSLLWNLEVAQAGKRDVELSYLTQGVGWSTAYVLTVNALGKTADLMGWVTLTNQSGGTWRDAKLKLLAGEVQRAQMAKPMAGRAGGLRMEADAVAAFAEEGFADYHLYTLQRPTTVRQNETKQVALLEARAVPITRRLVVDPLRSMGRIRPNEGEFGTGTLKPQVFYEFTNNAASHLGMPLPAGNIKVFGPDQSGSLQLIGEDQIGHTAREERVNLFVGRAFDIVVERKRVSFQYIRVGNDIRGAREEFATEIRNRKDTSDTVDLIERFGGEWNLTSDATFTKMDANSGRFRVELGPNASRTVKYTVETRW